MSKANKIFTGLDWEDICWRYVVCICRDILLSLYIPYCSTYCISTVREQSQHRLILSISSCSPSTSSSITHRAPGVLPKCMLRLLKKIPRTVGTSPIFSGSAHASYLQWRWNSIGETFLWLWNSFKPYYLYDNSFLLSPYSLCDFEPPILCNP